MTTIRRSRLPIVWLLLAAVLLLRGSVPVGWMPTAGQDGVRVALCTGMGSQFLTLGSDGRLHKEAPKPASPRDSCPFAVASAQATDLPPLMALPKAPASLSALDSPSLAVAVKIARCSLRPPARGPPEFV